MAKAKRSGAHWKNGYKAYQSQGRAHKNKVARIKRHLKNDPNDEVAKAALKRLEQNTHNGRTAPKRKTARWNLMLPQVEVKDKETGEMKPIGKPDLKKIPRIKTTVKTPEGDVINELFIQVQPTLNRLSGRLSSFGRKVQEEYARHIRIVKLYNQERRNGLKSFPKLPDWTTTMPSFTSEEDKQRFLDEYNVKPPKPKKRKVSKAKNPKNRKAKNPKK